MPVNSRALLHVQGHEPLLSLSPCWMTRATRQSERASEGESKREKEVMEKFLSYENVGRDVLPRQQPEVDEHSQINLHFITTSRLCKRYSYTL